MKLRFTKDILFLNPSVNLNKVALYLENYGVSVLKANTNKSIRPNGYKIVYKDDEHYNVFRFDILPTILPDLFYRFGDNIINRFFYNRFLKQNNICTATEYLIKNRFPLSEPSVSYYSDQIKLQDILRSDKIVILPYITSFDLDGLKFNKTVMEFRLYDKLDKFIGNDYAIVKNNGIYIEFFIKEDYIYFIADSFEFIEKVIAKTFLKNVKLDLTNKYGLLRNETTLIKRVSKNIYLVNDFSFFNISMNTGKKWVEALGEYICAGKL
jgi:hypothetical protein